MNEKKLIIATEITIPGIAYPEIDKLEQILRSLLLIVLMPKFTKKDRLIINNEEIKINFIELKFNSITSLLLK